MLKFEELVAAGAIGSNYKEVKMPNTDVITLSELQNMSQDDQAKFNGLIVLDKTVWLATMRATSPSLASVVLCYDGNVFGTWRRKKRTFSISKLVGGALHVVSNIDLPDLVENIEQIKEKETMNMEFTQFDSLEAGVTAEPMSAFDLGGEAPVVKDKNAEKEAIIASITEQTGDVKIADATEVTMFNKQYGRLFGFITPNNATVKISKKSKVVFDSNGKKILTQDAPEDIKAKYAETGVCPSKYAVKEDVIAFTHTKPGKPLGVIIGTPAGGDVSLTDIINKTGNVEKLSNDTNMVMHILPWDMAFTYLAALYDNKIKESEAVMGEEASYITHDCTVSKVAPKDGIGESSPKLRSALKHDRAMRKTLLTEKNYFPLKVYETVPYQNLSKEAAAMLNLHFEAMLSRKPEAFDSLRQSDKDKLTVDSNGVVTSEFFKAGASFDEAVIGSKIARYDLKDTAVTTVALPVREAKESKSSDKKKTYSFKFAKLEDTANGPFSIPEYNALFKATGMKEADFKEQITGLAGSKRKSTAKKASISADLFLKAAATKSGSFVDQKHSMKEIEAQLRNIPL